MFSDSFARTISRHTRSTRVNILLYYMTVRHIVSIEINKLQLAAYRPLRLQRQNVIASLTFV